MRRLFSLTLAAALVLCTVPAFAAPIKIKVSCQNPATDVPAKALETFKKVVEEKSQGKYVVDLYFSNALGACDSVVQGVQFGSINFGLEAMSNMSQFNSALAVIDTPYLLQTEDDCKAIFDSPFGKETFGHLLDKKGIKIYDVIFTSFRPVASMESWTTLEDIQGKKFRSTASKLHMAIIDALGMTPCPLPPSEMVTGIQQRVVDGSDTDITGLISFRFCDVIKNVLLADYSGCAVVFFGNLKWYEKLSAEDKAIFDEATAEFKKELIRAGSVARVETLKILQEKYGITIHTLTPEEKARWIEKTKKVYDLLNPEQKELVSKIQAELARVKAEKK